MTIRYTIGAVCLSAALMTATTASAATVELEFQSDVNAFLDENDANPWLVMTDYTAGDTTVSDASVGAYRVKANLFGAAADFLAFCLEPLVDFDLPAPYDQINKFGTAVTTQLNMLAENALNLVKSHETAAAFQMAAWEITTENSAPFGLDDGFFTVAGGSVNANLAKGIAEGWLDDITNGNWSAPTSSYMIFSSDVSQDLITSVVISAVPLPTSGLMMMTALLGVGGLTARRRRAARRS